MAKKFAYRLLKADRTKKWSSLVDLEKAELQLTGLGLEGWELISTFKQTNNSGISETVFVMKRRLETRTEDTAPE